MKRAVRIAQLEHHLCIGHGLHNLVMTDGIYKTESLKALSQKISRIVYLLRFKISDIEALDEAEERFVTNLEILEEEGVFHDISNSDDKEDEDFEVVEIEVALDFSDDSETGDGSTYTLPEKRKKTLKTFCKTRDGTVF